MTDNHELAYPGPRRLFSELLGTFMLVLAGAGAVVVGAVSGGQVSRTAAVAAPGLTVMAVILFMGAVSGAHLNPVVTIAFALRRDFPWRRVPGYVVAQFAGAALASLFLWALFGDAGRLGATEPGRGIADWKALLIELALTAGLVSTILGTASRAQNVGPLSAVGVGGSRSWGSRPISGASMNRHRWPRVVLNDYSHPWLHRRPWQERSWLCGFAVILRDQPPSGRRSARDADASLPSEHA